MEIVSAKISQIIEQMEDHHHDYRKSTQEIYLPKSLFRMLIH